MIDLFLGLLLTSFLFIGIVFLVKFLCESAEWRFYVGFKWNDRALMVLNAVIGIILFAGILRVMFA